MGFASTYLEKINFNSQLKNDLYLVQIKKKQKFLKRFYNKGGERNIYEETK